MPTDPPAAPAKKPALDRLGRALKPGDFVTVHARVLDATHGHVALRTVNGEPQESLFLQPGACEFTEAGPPVPPPAPEQP